MSTMVVNRFNGCMRIRIFPTMLRVSSLTHAYGKTQFTLPVWKDVQLMTVYPKTSATTFSSFLKAKINSSRSRQGRQRPSHTAQASESETITETTKIISEIEKRGEFEWPDLRVADFQDVDFEMHPSADVLGKHIKDWLLKHDIQTYFDSSDVFEKFLLHKAHRLVLGFFRNVPVGRAAWCSYVCELVFILDDMLDECADGNKIEVTLPKVLGLALSPLWSFPQELRPVIYKLLDNLDHVPEQKRQTKELFDKTVSEAILLKGTEYPYKLSPLGSGFREAWMMVVRESSPEYAQQLGTVFLETAFAVVKDGVNQSFQKFSDYDEGCIENREVTSGLKLSVSMAGFMYDAPIPDEVFYSPNVRLMLTETALAMRLINDIYSVRKDMKSTGLNALLLLAYDLNCSLNEAVIEAKKKLSKYNENMRALRSTIEAETSPENLRNVQITMKVCFYILGASIDYYQNSLRYTEG